MGDERNVPLSWVTFCCRAVFPEDAGDECWVEGEVAGVATEAGDEWLISREGTDALLLTEGVLDREDVDPQRGWRAYRVRAGSRGITFSAGTRAQLEDLLAQSARAGEGVEALSGGPRPGPGPGPGPGRPGAGVPPVPPPPPATIRGPFCAPTRPPACPPRSHQPPCPI